MRGDIGMPLPARMADVREGFLHIQAILRGGNEASTTTLPSLAFGRRWRVLCLIRRAVSDEHYKITLDAEIVLHARQPVPAEASRTVLSVEFQQRRDVRDIGLFATVAPKRRL